MAQAAATSPPLDVKSDDISGPLATQVQGEKLPQPVRGPSGSDGFPKFRNILDDAMLLLTYAAETGIEVHFTDKFGIKFAGRFSDQRSKEVETLAKSKINLRTETYYLSALMGF